MVRDATVSDNSAFVTLMQVAGETPAIRNKLVAILRQAPFHRTAVLHHYLDRLQHQGAPKALVAAIACLLDPEVADRALELLEPSR